MSNAEKLKETFGEMLKIHLDKDGIFPYPGVVMDTKGDIDVLSMALEPKEVIKTMLNHGGRLETDCLIFGIDRESGPDQGVDPKWKSVFTVVFMEPFKELSFGVFPYNSPEDCAEGIDWNCPFWAQVCHMEIVAVIAEKRGQSVEDTIKEACAEEEKRLIKEELKDAINPN